VNKDDYRVRPHQHCPLWHGCSIHPIFHSLDSAVSLHPALWTADHISSIPAVTSQFSHWHQIILLDDRGRKCEQLARDCHAAVLNWELNLSPTH